MRRSGERGGVCPPGRRCGGAHRHSAGRRMTVLSTGRVMGCAGWKKRGAPGEREGARPELAVQDRRVTVI